jgi:DNA-binding MurR/RpiR family transcriptional regulator
VGYNNVFARQVEAYGQPGDLLIGLSTSGRSKNLVEAFEIARQRNIGCISLLGGDGGDVLPLSDIPLVVPSSDPQRIQEIHILVLHLLCELVEEQLANGRWLPAMIPPGRSTWDMPANGRTVLLAGQVNTRK